MSDALRDHVRAEIETVTAARDRLDARLDVLERMVNDADLLVGMIELDGGGGVEDGPRAPAEASTPPRPARRSPVAQLPAPKAPRAPRAPAVGTAERAGRIVDLLRERGEMRPSDIARSLDVHIKGVARALDSLRDAQIVYREGTRTRCVYGLTAVRDAAMAAHGGRSPQRRGQDVAKLRWTVLQAITRDPGALNETRLAQALDADREDVALACGQLLVDGSLRMDGDGTYFPNRQAVAA